MLDDDDGVSPLYKAVQQLHDAGHIRCVQTGGGLVQHIDIALLVQIFSQLYPLALAAGQGGQWLSQGKIGQTHPDHRAQRLAELFVVPKEFTGLPGGHLQDLCDILSVIPVGQRFPAVAFALAGLADSGDRVHKHQLGDDLPPPAAGRAGALAVEGKQAGVRAGLRRHLPSDLIEKAQEGGGGGASRGRHRGLVHQHHPVGVLLGEHIPDERAFARARHTGDHGEHMQRDVHRHVFQIVQRGVPDGQKGLWLPRFRLEGDDLPHGVSRQRSGQQQRLVAALEQDLAAVFARQRSHVDDLVGDGDHILVVLHHQSGVTLVPQAAKQLGHPVHVPGVHPGAGLIEDISHPCEGAAHIPHQFEPLGLAAGQGRGLPVHGQVGQADVDHPLQGGHQSVHDGLRPGIADGLQHLYQLGELHGAHLINAVTRHLAGKGRGVEPPAPAHRTGALLHQVHQPLDRGLLQVGGVPVDEHPVQVVGNAFHLFGKLFAVRRVRAVEQAVSLLRGKVLPLFIQWEQAGLGVLLPVPVAHVEGGQVGHALVPGFFRVDAALDIHGHHLADAGAFRTHAVGVVEGKIRGRSHIGGSDAGIKQPQGGVQVADGPHRGAGVAPQAALVHNDRGGQIVDALHPGLFIFGQPPPHEGGIGLVHLPLALGGDGVKDDAGFAGAGHSGKNHDLPLWDLQRHIFQVVLAKALNDDGILLHASPPHVR